MKRKKTILNYRVQRIEDGKSLRKTLIDVNISSKTFYEWVNEDKEKQKQYARDRAKGIIL